MARSRPTSRRRDEMATSRPTTAQAQAMLATRTAISPVDMMVKCRSVSVARGRAAPTAQDDAIDTTGRVREIDPVEP